MTSNLAYDTDGRPAIVTGEDDLQLVLDTDGRPAIVYTEQVTLPSESTSSAQPVSNALERSVDGGVSWELVAEGRILDPTDPTGERLGVELDAWENVPDWFTYRVEIISPAITTQQGGAATHAGQHDRMRSATPPHNPGESNAPQ